ncbi:restriction endonuclease subunit S [Segatella copri]|uniref:Restriction endonuclease subunit S n=1 Tax=Segatella copri TaxID=165179 RepID=A0AA92TZX3_9BACT|nr:restriction endonuclease subunit S [Segatella copri]RGW44139.1 restriction endonuclease subunit S [Segatella copri]
MEWKEVRLGDVCSELSDGLHKAPKFIVNGEYIFVNAKNLYNGYILDNDPTKKTSHEEYLKYKKPLGKHTILYSIDGTIGNIAKYRGEKCVLGKGACYINCNPEIVESSYLYYQLQSPHFKSYIHLMSTGSTIKHISLKTMRDYVFELPSLEDQRRIASILSSLDRKIELNNKINADLKEMAQAIFKNWFVDFEPFKDGKFVDSELGMIPEGWKVGTLGELCNFKRGKNLLTKNAIDEGVPVVAGGLEPSCYHNIANTGAPVITVSGSGANAGFMRMYHVPVWASDCSFIDISCENFYFVYCFLKVNSKLLKHAQTGAVQPHVKPSDIHDFELVIPYKESIYDFQDKVKPFFDKIALIQKENSRLSLLRDTLLPRLMSGELEVPE